MSDSEFTRVVQEANKLVPNFADSFAVYFGVSMPTVRRWVDGRNMPHEYMRAQVVKSIENFLTDCMEAE